MFPSSPDRADETPHSLIRDEMRRQNADALTSIKAAAEVAAQAALSIRRQGQVLMLGMGASHWANRMALAAYRAAGIDARAEVLSEAMRMPPGGRGSTLILTSQSGESGEIARWLADNPDRPDVFGMTLQPQLARTRGARPDRARRARATVRGDAQRHADGGAACGGAGSAGRRYRRFEAGVARWP